MCGSDIFLGIIAIFVPPLAVCIKTGCCSADVIINIALCVLGFLPGLLHAWYIIAITPDPTYEELAQDPERGQTNYYYISHQQTPSRQTYGTLSSTPNSQFPVHHNAGFVQPQPAAQQSTATSSDNPPPSYQQAVEGDNKVQKP